MDYHSIKKASIIIDGITVLTGENGCGKSTLSRWLYYTIKGAAGFEKFLYKEYVASLQSVVSKWNFVSRDILRNEVLDFFKQGQQGYNKIAFEQFDALMQLDRFSTEDVERAQMIYFQILDAFSEQLYNYFREETREVRKRRIQNFLEIKLDDFETTREAVDAFVKTQVRWGEKKMASLMACLHERKIKDFVRIVSNEFGESDNFPIGLQLNEDGLDLLDDGRLAMIYNLHKTVYVDTPMAISSNSHENYFWDELQEIMLSAPSRDISIDTKLLIRRIKKMLGGEARLVKDDAFDDWGELRYVSDDDTVDIELSKAATGIKTFIYLQRLLQNGYLTNSTLLLIDEPEAHLHPQWIVEYARLLVLINKNLGTKIMIASHNPDMVAAIRSIAEKEGRLDYTHFYLAEKTEETHQYVYRHLEHEIGDVFRSFNIALDRIKLYGADSF